MDIEQIKFLVDEAEEMCPKCGMRLFDSEVCDYCHWRRHEEGTEDETPT
jgi:hypothetical protein|tara:strand:- start:4 stop:150 length:147 start_codon:yes stop_codon:yes gene_type:complete